MNTQSDGPNRNAVTTAQPGAALIASSEPALISVPAPAGTTSKAVCVRFSPEEHAVLTAYAEKYHLSIPELLRLSWSAMRRAEENAHV